MEYAIDCSVADIEGFLNVLSNNMEAMSAIFCAKSDGVIFTSYSYGGVVGEAYGVLCQNAETVETLGRESLGLLSSDLDEARYTLQHDREVLQQVIEQISEMETRIGQQQEVIRQCSAELSRCKQEQTRINHQTVPSFGDSPEAKKAEAQAKKQLADARQQANRNVQTAAHNYSEANNLLERMRREKARLEANREKIKQIIYDLERLMSQMEGKRQQIYDHMNACKNKIDSLKHHMKSTATQYLRWQNEMVQYGELAQRAAECVRSIHSNLAAAAETEARNSERVKIESPATLKNFAFSLQKRQREVEEQSEELLELIRRVRHVMRDNVTANSSELLRKSEKIIAEQISDFDEKSAHFQKAAQALSRYMSIG